MLGQCTQDLSWQVAQLPSGPGKHRATGWHGGGGGLAANAAVAAARLGAAVQFWGRAGQDSAGRAMRDDLATQGVGVDGLRLFEGGRSSVSAIVVDAAGERLVLNFRGSGLPADPSWLPLHTLAQADAVLVDPRWPEGALALLQAARGRGLPTVLDGDVAEAAVFDTLLPWVDHAVFSAPGLAAYLADRAPPGLALPAQLAFARSRGCRLAAVTQGAHGVHWDAGQGLQHQRALPVAVADSTGAGDAFHGAFTVAIGAAWPVAHAFGLASAVAALKCQHAGGRNGLPDWPQALAAWQQLKDPA